MFNFNLMNRALKDAELKDAFRMLYYIVNKCSLKNSMSVEIFDAEFELALSISPRSTCRFTKKLEERGYIKKEVRGTSQNKLANIYTLIDIDTKDDKNDILTDNANIDGSSDGRIGILKNNIKIKKNKLFLSNTSGIYTGTNINTGHNTTEEINNIKPEVNNKTYINSDINKNKFIKHDVNNINVNNSDEEFLNNFMKVDNINTVNSNTEIKNLRIENKNKFIENDVTNINTGNSDDPMKDLRIKNNINLNNDNEMNEERVNGMNNINNSIKNTMNTPTLEEILENQALDDQQVFNTTGNSENIGNKYSQEDQERYTRLFNKCKSQIEIWVKKHDYSCISMFDAYFKAIQDMNNENLISVKQWDAAQRCLFQRFMNLRNGYDNFIQNKKKHISSNEVNECNIPPTPTQIIDKINATA